MGGSIIRSQIERLLEHLEAGLVQRESHVRLCLLGALAGENVLLLGPPGTAKSLLARRVADAFDDADYFQYLLTRFTTPDEIFGPISLAALRDEDVFRRKVDGYLPTARVAFLDEIFKASSAILNALLTLINEGLFFNGREVQPARLQVLLAASNELPQDESLLALFDRFSLRLLVGPVEGREGFVRLLQASGTESALDPGRRLTEAVVHMVRKEAERVRVPDEVALFLAEIKEAVGALIDEEDPYRYYVSDRRWRHMLRLLRTSAYIHGRDAVNLVDCALIRHCLWSRPEDVDTMGGLLHEAYERRQARVALDLDPVEHDLLALKKDVVKEGRGELEQARVHLSWDGGSVSLTNLEEVLARKNSFEFVLTNGIFWEKSRKAFAVLDEKPNGGISTEWGWVENAEEWKQSIRAGYPPQLSALNASRTTSGADRVRLSFHGLHDALKQHWLRLAKKVDDQIAEREGERLRIERRLAAQVDEHLFVESAEVRGLQVGLAAARLELAQVQDRLRAITEALVAGTEVVVSPEGLGLKPRLRVKSPSKNPHRRRRR